MWRVYQNLSIRQRIYLILFGGILYSILLIGLSYYQSLQTKMNFELMQNNQIRLIMIAENIKTKLSRLQNLQVRQVVDNMMEMENSGDDIDLLLPEILGDLTQLRTFAKDIQDEALIEISNNLNRRYGAIVSAGINMDFEMFREEPNEAFFAIEGLIAVADKMNEELGVLIGVANESLQKAIVDFQNKLDRGVHSVFFFGLVAIFVFLTIGVLFIRSLNRRITMLIRGTASFSRNEFDYRIPADENSCRDELCQLASSFNEMAASIETLVKEQKEINATLDQKVQEKTKELESSLLELEKTNMIVMDSIHYASRIQHSFLPEKEKMHQNLGEHFVIWNQRDVVGGDFYWMERVEQGTVVALIDCTGHGVPGSLMTMLAVPILDRLVREQQIHDPGEILSRLNRMLKQMLNKSQQELGDDGLDIGVCFVPDEGDDLMFAGAGIPLFYARNGEVTEVKGARWGIGYRDTPEDQVYENHRVPILAETSFYMATDGITEQVGGREKRMMFGKKRLKKLIESIHHHPKQEQRTLILEALMDYRGSEPQKDDMTCISFKIAA